MMEALRSSEMSVLTRATRRHVPEDGSLNFTVVIAVLNYVIQHCAMKAHWGNGGIALAFLIATSINYQVELSLLPKPTAAGYSPKPRRLFP
jgi:hypothetical protein